MNALHWVGLGVRLFALGIMITTLRGLATLAGMRPETAVWGASAVVAALLVIVAVLLWMFPLSVAWRLLPPSAREADASAAGADATRLQAVGFSLVGLWLLLGALIDASYWAIYFVALRQPEFADVPWASPEAVASLVATGVELLLGVALLFGADGLSRLLHRFRYAGARYTDADADPESAA